VTADPALRRGRVVFFIHQTLGFAACYLAATALFYYLFMPASETVSLLTASRKIGRQNYEQRSIE
jgi:hypothetical protein